MFVKWWALLSVAQVFLFALFTMSFLNVKQGQRPKAHEADHLPKGEYPLIDKLVFIVIDALREDFVFGPNSPMSFTKMLIENGSAVPYIAKASAPTVTLPRLKALTAGTPPVFLDFISNLNEGKQNDASDSWVKQLYLTGKKIVFLGDDTWLRLFPREYFIRADPTTSFYVKVLLNLFPNRQDTVIVDRNVTRHIREEFTQNKDWDVLIMHYLGVDHVGHVEGAKGYTFFIFLLDHRPLMGPKLQEMDSVIETVYKLTKSHLGDQRTAIFVLGDHGMSDSGNHGGASPEEVNTACIVIGNPPFPAPKNRAIQVINQLDLVPTISLLFDVPIPSSSIGKFILPLFAKLPIKRQIELLRRNLYTLSPQCRLHLVCDQCTEADSKECRQCLENAESQLLGEQVRLLGSSGSYNHILLLSCILLCLTVSYLSHFHRTGQSTLMYGLGILYFLSIMSSSFIEEEHTMWNHVVPFMIVWNSKDAKSLLLSLFAARLLATWNSNGYEYRHLQDMKMFLSDHQTVQAALLVGSMLYFSAKGKFWILNLVFGGLSLLFKSEMIKGPFVSRVLLTLFALVFTFDGSVLPIMLIALNKTHNAFPFVLLDIVSSYGECPTALLIHHSYFVLGGSNLISSIDLSNSYIGLTEYNAGWVGLMTFVILFSGPIFVLFKNNAKMNTTSFQEVWKWRASVQLAVMMCCFIQRHHISIWTIFTPRLLFECLWTLFYGLATLVLARKGTKKSFNYEERWRSVPIRLPARVRAALGLE